MPECIVRRQASELKREIFQAMGGGGDSAMYGRVRL